MSSSHFGKTVSNIHLHELLARSVPPNINFRSSTCIFNSSQYPIKGNLKFYSKTFYQRRNYPHHDSNHKSFPADSGSQERGLEQPSRRNSMQKFARDTNRLSRSKESTYFNSLSRLKQGSAETHGSLNIKRKNNKIVVEKMNQSKHLSKKDIKKMFLKWCNDLARQGSCAKLESFVDVNEFTFREYRMGNIIDTSTDEIFLSSVLLAYVNSNRISRAEEFFIDRFKTSISPNGITIPKTMFPFCNLIKGFAKSGNIQKVEEWSEVLKDELPDLLREYQSLLTGFRIMALLKHDRIEDALRIFRKEATRYDPEALSQESERLSPLKSKTVTPLMNALAKRLRIHDVEEIYNAVILFSANASEDIILHNTLLDAYSRVGDEASLWRVLRTYFVFPDTPPDLTIADRFINTKQYLASIPIKRAQKHGIVPNEYTCLNFLRLWAARGDVEKVEEYLKIFLSYLHPEGRQQSKAYTMLVLAHANTGNAEAARNVFVNNFKTGLLPDGKGRIRSEESDYSNLLRVYANNGDESSLNEILKVMEHENLIGRLTINTIIRGFSESNNVELMRKYFHQYCVDEKYSNYIRPDAFTFNTIMNSFAHLGQVEKVEQLSQVMESYGITPNSDTLLVHIMSKFNSGGDATCIMNDLRMLLDEKIPPHEHEITMRYLVTKLARHGSVEYIETFIEHFSKGIDNLTKLAFFNALLLSHVVRGDAWSVIFQCFQSHFVTPISISSEGLTPDASTIRILLKRLKKEPNTLENENVRKLLEGYFQNYTTETQDEIARFYDEYVEEV